MVKRQKVEDIAGVLEFGDAPRKTQSSWTGLLPTRHRTEGRYGLASARPVSE